MRIALYQPDIAGNVGTILRLAACWQVAVDIILPCGFPASDAQLRRAAMDYGGQADVTRHANFASFEAARLGGPARLVAFTSTGDTRLTPVVRKDFMVDPWQVLESRSIGADAILIIVAALSDQQMKDIEDVALGLGMDALIEVHDEAELERALTLKSRLIGVNNRNLKDFTVDFARTYELVGRAPEGCTFVAESGLGSKADLDAMADHGVRCFLVGESLMRQQDVEAATRALIGT